MTCLAKNVRALVQENMHMPSWVCDPIPLSSAAILFQTTLPKSYSAEDFSSVFLCFQDMNC